MPRYRVHILDRLGDLVGVVDVDCWDDEGAKERVRGLLEGHETELWRLVDEPSEPSSLVKH